jgi:hypothetical protein
MHLSGWSLERGREKLKWKLLFLFSNKGIGSQGGWLIYLMPGACPFRLHCSDNPETSQKYPMHITFP